MFVTHCQHLSNSAITPSSTRMLFHSARSLTTISSSECRRTHISMKETSACVLQQRHVDRFGLRPFSSALSRMMSTMNSKSILEDQSTIDNSAEADSRCSSIVVKNTPHLRSISSSKCRRTAISACILHQCQVEQLRLRPFSSVFSRTMCTASTTNSESTRQSTADNSTDSDSRSAPTSADHRPNGSETSSAPRVKFDLSQSPYLKWFEPRKNPKERLKIREDQVEESFTKGAAACDEFHLQTMPCVPI